MDANSAINFATRTEQVSERKVGFNGTCILFKHIEKQVYRFILLITKQEVNPRYVITRQAVGFILLVLLRTSAAHIPAIGSGYRQKQKQQLQHRKLFLRRRRVRRYSHVSRR